MGASTHPLSAALHRLSLQRPMGESKPPSDRAVGRPRPPPTAQIPGSTFTLDLAPPRPSWWRLHIVLRSDGQSGAEISRGNLLTPSTDPISFLIPKKTQLAETGFPCRSLGALSWKSQIILGILTTPKPAAAEIKEIYVRVICEGQSQTNGSFVLTSAQLSRLDGRDLANPVRNGGALVSVQAPFLLRSFHV